MIEILETFVNLIPVTLGQSLMYGFVAVGIMIPFRLLDLPDLTCEGSFPLGGCAFAAMLTWGVPPPLALVLAVVAGFAAGCATAFIHLRFRIHTLLAGILVFTMLWSVNLRIMGKPNIPLPLGAAAFGGWSGPIFDSTVLSDIAFAVLAAAAVAVMYWLFTTEVGLRLRCVGANQRLSPALGIDVGRYVVVGMGLAGAFCALGGVLVTQTQTFADVTMGFGVLVNGLAALIIGEAVTGRATVLRQFAAPFIGSIVYYQLVSLALALGLLPSDLKFVTGIFVLAALALPRLVRKSEA
jgi:putative ABC transport system permease protein